MLGRWARTLWALGAVSWMAAASPAAAQDQEDGEAPSDAEAEVPTPPAGASLPPVEVRFSVFGRDDAEVVMLPDPVLESDPDGALVVRRPPASAYVGLCDAPCRVDLHQSHYGLGVRIGEGVHRFLEPLGIDGPTRVEIDVVDNAAARLAGGLLMTIGGLAGIALSTISVGVDVGEDSNLDELGVAGLITGGLTLGVSFALGISFLEWKDDATYEAVPLPSTEPGVYSDEF